MDKLTIFLPAARQCKLTLLAGSLCLLLGACASMSPEQGEDGDVDAAASQSSSAEAMFHITTAERLVEVGEYASALKEYLAAAQVSSDPEIARMVTRLAVQLDNWPAASTAADRWLALDEDADSAHHVRIIARVNQSQPDAAMAAMTGWLDGDYDADSSDWWRHAAMLLAVTDSAEVAETVFDRLESARGGQAPVGELAHARSILHWRLDQPRAALGEALEAADASGRVDHLIWAAELAVESDHAEQALALYRQARARRPEDFTLALAEAEVLRQLERQEEAVALLEGLPDSTGTLYSLGVYLTQLGHEARAEAAWQRLRDLPESEWGGSHAFLVARLAELIGRDEAALTWYERVSDPTREQESRLRRAVTLGRLGQVDAGQEILAGLREDAEQALALDTWLIEAEMLRSNGRAEESIELLREPLMDNSNNTDLLYARALSAATAGDVDLAEQDLRRVIQMDGDHAMALNALGYTLTDQTDRYQEAYQLIKRALELDPEDAATLDSMGWVLYRLGRGEEAVGYLRRALEGSPNPEIMAHLIEVLDQTGHREEAGRLSKRALARHPDDDYLRATLQRLDHLQ